MLVFYIDYVEMKRYTIYIDELCEDGREVGDWVTRVDINEWLENGVVICTKHVSVHNAHLGVKLPKSRKMAAEEMYS